MRAKNESTGSYAATRVQRSFLMGNGDYMVVALANNRFCFKKGATRLFRVCYYVYSDYSILFMSFPFVSKLRPRISRMACTW